MTAWLQDKLGPVGAILVQILGDLVVALCVMISFGTLQLTLAKAMMLRWVSVVMPSEQTQLPLLAKSVTDGSDEEVKVAPTMMGRQVYAFTFYTVCCTSQYV